VTARIEDKLGAQLERMERARSARLERPVMRETHITLSHGSGGKASHQLIDSIILPALANPLLDGVADAAVLSRDVVGTERWERLAFTTDSYVVHPLFFPGGDIGRLAVHGTINDLAMAGARPLCLSLSFVIEEGLPVETLRRVVDSIAHAAGDEGTRVPVVTGDTKVVPRGKADQLFVNTSGIGAIRDDVSLSAANVKPGDRVLLSGFIADHGMAVMLAREALELESEIRSDSASLHSLVETLLDAAPNVRVLKDPTRGGVATSLNEIARHARVAIAVDEASVPVRPETRGACEILGIDPLHIANEGKLLAVVPADATAAALAALRSHPLGRDACCIGDVHEQPEGMVVLRTPIGGSRVLDMLVGDPLPRIC
jgi:hydrogenase expression/formation protein HypE